MSRNEYGVGAPCETKDAIKASEEPGSPEDLHCTDITKSSVTLQWTRSNFDGGSEILEYIIEQQIKGFDNWKKIASTKANVFTKCISSLTENQQYAYRVIAKNSCGIIT